PQRDRGSREECGKQVVVRAADRVHQQRWVQSDENCSAGRVEPASLGGPGDDEGQRNRGGPCKGLVRPQGDRRCNKAQRKAEECEQRPVGTWLVLPEDEREDR